MKYSMMDIFSENSQACNRLSKLIMVEEVLSERVAEKFGRYNDNPYEKLEGFYDNHSEKFGGYNDSNKKGDAGPILVHVLIIYTLQITPSQ